MGKAINKEESLWTLDFLNLMVVSTLIRMCSQLQMTSFPLFIQSLGGTKSIAGLTMTFYTIAALVVRPFAGNLIDKKGRWKFLILGTSVYMLSTFMYGFTFVIPLLILLRIIHGLSFSIQSTSSSTMLTDILPKSRLTEGIGYFGVLGTCAAAIAPSLALYIIDAYNYSLLFYIAAAVALLSLFLSFFLNYEKRRAKAAESQSIEEIVPGIPEAHKLSKWENLFERNAIFPSSILFFVGFSTSAISVFLPTFALANSIKNIGTFFTVQAVMLALTRLFVGKISKRIGSNAVIIASLALTAVPLFGIFIVRSLSSLLIMAALLGISGGCLIPELNAMAVINCPPTRRGVASATFFTFMDFAIGVGSAVWGVVADAAGVNTIYLFASIIPVLGIIFFIYAGKWKRKKSKINQNINC